MKKILLLTSLIISCSQSKIDHELLNVIQNAEKCYLVALSKRGNDFYRDYRNVTQIEVKPNELKGAFDVVLNAIGKGEKAICFSAHFALIYIKGSERVELIPSFDCGNIKIFSSFFEPITDPGKLRPGETKRDNFLYLSLDQTKKKSFYQKIKNLLPKNKNDR